MLSHERSCLPWRHNWTARSVQHVEDVSLGSPGLLRTDVLQRCDRCGRSRVRNLRGFWRLEALR